MNQLMEHIDERMPPAQSSKNIGGGGWPPWSTAGLLKQLNKKTAVRTDIQGFNVRNERESNDIKLEIIHNVQSLTWDKLLQPRRYVFSGEKDFFR